MKGRIEDRTQPNDGRSEQRRRLYLSSSAAQANGSRAADILDLSASGLLISTGAELDLDEPVTVVLADGAEHRAQIMWHTGRLYGCRFDHPLSQAELGSNLLRAHPPRALPPASDEAPGGASETMGDRLRRLRMASPHTMTELARLAGVTKPTLWKWETGKARPRHDALVRISDVLGVAEAELLYGRGPGYRAGAGRETPPAPAEGKLAVIVQQARHEIAEAAGVDPAQVAISIDFK